MDKEALQQAFDKAYLGLKAQGFERSHKNEACLYRGPDGKKCALGHVIPDEHYLPEMEHDSAFAVVEQYPEVVPVGLRGDWGKRALHRLQRCHDQALDPEDMQRRLVHYAEDWGLTVPEEETK